VGSFRERVVDGKCEGKRNCKRLNDNATVVEITLPIQSSALWWSNKEGRWQSMYGKWADTNSGGDSSRLGWGGCIIGHSHLAVPCE
jgi:hypothetical protein